MLIIGSLYYLQSHLAEKRQILCGVLLSCTAVILLESHIKMPVQSIFNRLMIPSQRSVISGVGKILVADIVSCLIFFPAVFRYMKGMSVNLDQSLEIWPPVKNSLALNFFSRVYGNSSCLNPCMLLFGLRMSRCSLGAVPHSFLPSIAICFSAMRSITLRPCLITHCSR